MASPPLGAATAAAAAADADPGTAELFAKASKLHAAGDRAAAESAYRAVLKLSPRHADAQHMLGALLIQLHGDKKCEEARCLLQGAINARPSCAKFRQSLGIMLQACGRQQDAVDAFERANEKDPMNVQTLTHLARALRDVGRNLRAAEVYRSVVMLEPEHPKAHYQRATCLRAAGRTVEALASLRQHQRLFPDDEQTRFWIAAMQGDAAAMQAMPAGLVAGLFDQYADKFDDHLVNQLQYRTPNMLMEALLLAPGSSGVSPSPLSRAPGALWRRAVDLGCGTGLMGPLLRPHVSGCLEGVDLSAGMVDKAREKGCYDRLAVAELVSHIEQCGFQPSTSSTPNGCPEAQGSFQAQSSAMETDAEAKPAPTPSAEPDTGLALGKGARPTAAAGNAATSGREPYDLLVAADVFVYIGSLGPVMQAAARHSCSGALFAFSTEALEGREDRQAGNSNSSVAGGYAITCSGRYAHSQAYLRTVAEASGWRVLHLSSGTIRCNAGKPVQGHLCVLQRQG